MVDVERQILHWREGALDEWEAAEALLVAGKTRQCLFWVHLALEKALKAHVCRATSDVAPRIHNLARLVKMAKLNPTRKDLEILVTFNEFNLEGRYPEAFPTAPSTAVARSRLEAAREVFEWLLDQ